MKRAKHFLHFKIDDSHCLSLDFVGPYEDLCTYCGVKIKFYKKNKKYILYKDFIGPALEIFEYQLEKALNNKLFLHQSIINDIGFLWNEYLQNKKEYNFVEVPLENPEYWIGSYYELWSTRGRYAWIYNDDEGIFLEITPCYRWHYIEPEKNEKYIPYKEFIKKYKPIAIIKIDKDIAMRWLRQVKKLRNIIQKNDIIYEKQGGHF